MVAIVSQKREAIHRAVRDMYTAVASAPQQKFHFPTGRAACEKLGYPAEQLDAVSADALESFAGVGYPFAADAIREGDTVLDVGSGSGTDALIAARLTGAHGRVYALDMTAEMRVKLQRVADTARVGNLTVIEGDAEQIPLPDASVDVVTTNGVLNLVPDKARAIGEIYRVLKPGGQLQISDIALAKPVSERFRQDPQMWAECVVGALEEERYLAMLGRVGFENVERLASLDYFALSSNDKTREVAGLFTAHSVSLRARKPLTATSAETVVPLGRAVINVARESVGVVAAVFAWLACAGFPAVIAGLGAVGAGSFAEHAYMYPAYAGALGLSVWLLWRSGRLREELRPFWLALTGAVFAVMTTGLAIFEVARWLAWWSYLGVAGVVVASAWSFILARRPGSCITEMIVEARLRERRGPLLQRVAFGAAAWIAVGTVLYALYWATDTYAW